MRCSKSMALAAPRLSVTWGRSTVASSTTCACATRVSRCATATMSDLALTPASGPSIALVSALLLKGQRLREHPPQDNGLRLMQLGCRAMTDAPRGSAARLKARAQSADRLLSFSLALGPTRPSLHDPFPRRQGRRRHHRRRYAIRSRCERANRTRASLLRARSGTCHLQRERPSKVPLRRGEMVMLAKTRAFRVAAPSGMSSTRFTTRSER
mmetsp:Transcript_30707/g.91732  ORF Transcript_30707/g.91732 Transcript_30707/m.91732 type:complete len:212 (+) Transcript_30707:276-911(+)